MKPYEGKHETLKVVLKVLPCHLTSHHHVVERLHVHSLGSKIHGQAVDVLGRPFAVSSVHGPQQVSQGRLEVILQALPCHLKSNADVPRA